MVTDLGSGCDLLACRSGLDSAISVATVALASTVARWVLSGERVGAWKDFSLPLPLLLDGRDARGRLGRHTGPVAREDYSQHPHPPAVDYTPLVNSGVALPAVCTGVKPFPRPRVVCHDVLAHTQ